jgi:type II secretory pathway pseudopilin PulG
MTIKHTVRLFLIPHSIGRAAGFTLIETALALLAIGLGLMAIFGLGRIGLQTTKESENDTRCVQMADAVFETLRETNARFVDAARTNQVRQSWYDLWTNTLQTADRIPFPPVANMCSSRQPPLSQTLYLRPETQLAAAFQENELSLAEWNPRYELAVRTKYQPSPVAGGQNLFQVTLAIYPDGDTYSSEYRIFHTTLSNTGGLP